MPPPESSILTQTLLPPSSLHTILSLKQFTALFPTLQRSNPQIPILYRALQIQRGLDLDAVRENIAQECERGRLMVRELARSRARDAREARVIGGEMDGAANAAGSLDAGESKSTARLDAKGLCEGVEEACGILEMEVQVLEDEVRALVDEVEGLVDGLDGEGLRIVGGEGLGRVLEEVRRKAERRMEGGQG